MTDYVYDIETYPNVFTLTIKEAGAPESYQFEISERRNDLPALVNFVRALSARGDQVRMVGFNNIGFDYPILHMIMSRPGIVTVADIYRLCDAIINGPDRWAHTVWESEWLVPQLDLFKIHHFDNIARATKLKIIEFNMRSEMIEDLPFPPGTYLTPDQIDILLQYNDHDVRETEKFYYLSLEQIRFREELSVKYGRNFLNDNDTKIGKQFFIMELEKVSPDICFERVDGRRQPRQTLRGAIKLADAVFPYIQFAVPEFQRICDWFKHQTIVQTKGVFKDLSCTVDNFDFHFGTGGIHGSVESRTVESDETHVIIDLDVTSYYPSIAIVNRCFPAHLGALFCDIYASIKAERAQYDKSTPENAMLKLALNGVYGDSNNAYSPFYDSLYTMTITINGQLLLCLLYEKLRAIGEIELIQINTDGLTIRVPRSMRPFVESICKSWEDFTKLDLESVDYSRMFIRDVNNYIAEGIDGKLKRKGDYQHAPPGERKPLGWHQDMSAMIVPKAVEAALVRGEDVSEYIKSGETDLYDFMLRTKVPRSSRLMWGDQQVQNVTRYYMSTVGQSLTKIMPPLAKQIKKNPDAPERYFAIAGTKGFITHVCNDIRQANAPIDYDWYIREAKKLIDPLR